MNIKNISKRELFVDYIPTVLAGILIICFAIVKEQTFLKTLPTLITLIVLLMSVHANRFAFLVGASNCVLYTLAYISEGLYFSAASAFLVSMPIQIFSFFVWSRHKEGKTKAKLARMKGWQIAVSLVACVPLWVGCYFGLSSFFDASYAEVDCLLFVLGLVVSALVAFRFVEGQYLNALSCLISLALWIVICYKDPSNINYVIISVYNLFRTVEAAINWTCLYKRRKNEGTLI